MGKEPRIRHINLRRCVASLLAAVTATISGIGLDLPVIGAKTAYAGEPAIVDSASAVNYSSILGRAVDYGILAKEFTKQGHMETTYAVYKYTGDGNSDVDLSESGTAQFIVGELGENSKIVLGKVGENTKTFSIEAPKEIFEGYDVNKPDQNGKYIEMQQGFRPKATIYPKYTEKSVIESNIDRMIGHICDESEELDRKAKDSRYRIDLSDKNILRQPSDAEKKAHGWDDCSCLLDLSDSKYENSVVYVNVNDSQFLREKTFQTNQLYIYKPSSTVVVMNVDDEGSVNLVKYSVSVVGGETFASNTDHSGSITEHNKLVNKDMAQKIIWNLKNATTVTIDVSAGTFLIPNENAHVSVGSSAGWLATGGKATNGIGEWHYIYEGTNEDTNSDLYGQIHFAARKSFTYELDSSVVGNGKVFKPNEDKTVRSESGDYKFHFYEADENFKIKNEIPKYLENGDEKSIVNEVTNKIKFPVLSFSSDESAIEEGRKGCYFVAENTTETFYFVIKEENAGVIKNGIRNSDGEVDIKLVVENNNGDMAYTVSYVTYLDAAKTIYKSNEDVSMSGIEFSLGAFFNYKTDVLKILKKNQFGSLIKGATLKLTAVDDEGDEVSLSGVIFDGATLNKSRSNAEKGYIVWESQGKAFYLRNLPDGYYTVEEIYAPDGHEKADSLFDIEIRDGSITKTVASSNGTTKANSAENTIELIDFSHFEISKVDQFGKEVEGATLELSNENGGLAGLKVTLGEDAESVSQNDKAITWKSGTTSTFIKNLPNGNYTLTETNCPKGYSLAESITFVVNNGVIVAASDEDVIENGNKIIMVDAAESESSTLAETTQTTTALQTTATTTTQSTTKETTTQTTTNTTTTTQATTNTTTTTEKPTETTTKETTTEMTSESKSNNKADPVKILKKNQFGDLIKGATLKFSAVDDEGDAISIEKALFEGAELNKSKSNVQKGYIVWESNGEPFYLSNLPNGHYTIEELYAPDGYEKAATLFDIEIKNGSIAKTMNSSNGSTKTDNVENTIELIDFFHFESTETTTNEIMSEASTSETTTSDDMLPSGNKGKNNTSGESTTASDSDYIETTETDSEIESSTDEQNTVETTVEQTTAEKETSNSGEETSVNESSDPIAPNESEVHPIAPNQGNSDSSTPSESEVHPIAPNQGNSDSSTPSESEVHPTSQNQNTLNPETGSNVEVPSNNDVSSDEVTTSSGLSEKINESKTNDDLSDSNKESESESLSKTSEETSTEISTETITEITSSILEDNEITSVHIRKSGGSGSSSQKASIKTSKDNSSGDKMGTSGTSSKDDGSDEKINISGTSNAEDAANEDSNTEDTVKSNSIETVDETKGDSAQTESETEANESNAVEGLSVNDSSDNTLSVRRSSSDDTAFFDESFGYRETENSNGNTSNDRDLIEIYDVYDENVKADENSASEHSSGNDIEEEIERDYYSSVSAKDASEATGATSDSSVSVEKASANVTNENSGRPEGSREMKGQMLTSASDKSGGNATGNSSGSLPQTGSPINMKVLLGIGILLLTAGIFLIREKTHK